MREPGKRASRSKAERRFCLECGSALWLFDPRWPELIHPHASAIDTPLAEAAEVVEAALDYVAGRGSTCRAARATCSSGQWPEESLEDWHKRHRLWSP